MRACEQAKDRALQEAAAFEEQEEAREKAALEAGRPKPLRALDPLTHLNRIQKSHKNALIRKRDAKEQGTSINPYDPATFGRGLSWFNVQTQTDKAQLKVYYHWKETKNFRGVERHFDFLFYKNSKGTQVAPKMMQP